MLPLPSTIGTKSTCVPNFLYSIDDVPRLCGTRIGNSPPLLNNAGRPLTVTSVGSASTLTRSLRRRASMKPKKRRVVAHDAEAHGVAAGADGGRRPRGRSRVDQAADAATRRSRRRLMVDQSMPNVRSRVRETSFTFTLQADLLHAADGDVRDDLRDSNPRPCG